MILMGVSFLIMGLTGLILPFLIHIWNKVWIWVSIVLMLFVFIYMAKFNETHYKQLRRLVGLPYMQGNKELPAEPPSSPRGGRCVTEKQWCHGHGRGWIHYPRVRIVADDLQTVLMREEFI